MRLVNKLIAFAGPRGSDKTILSDLLSQITGLTVHSYSDSGFGSKSKDALKVAEGVVMNVSSQGRVDAVRDNGGLIIHVTHKDNDKRTSIKRASGDLVVGVGNMKVASLYRILTQLHQNALVVQDVVQDTVETEDDE